MDEHAKCVLRELGFVDNPDDYAKFPYFSLLEPILSSIQKENILSHEEADALEWAEGAGLGRDAVMKKLVEHGIDEDILEIDESDIEYFQKKLQECKSNTWDNCIDTLRKEEATLTKIVEEMQKKIQQKDFENHVRQCEVKWKEINDAIQNVCQEIEELKSVNDNHQNVVDHFLPYRKELKKFMEHEAELVNEIYNRIFKNEYGVENGHAYNSKEEMKQIIALEPRFTCLHFERIMKAKENEYSVHMENSDKNAHYSLTAVPEEFSHIHCVLSLSKKLAQLDVKELALQNLDQRKAQTAEWLVSSTNLLQILEEQRTLLDLVFIVQSLYNEERSSVQEIINSCYKNIHQEFTNISTRVKNLEVASQNFKTFLTDKTSNHDTFPEELGRLCTKHFPGEKGNIEDMTTNFETNLQNHLEQQKILLIASKRELTEVDETVTKFQLDINSAMEIFSQIELGCNSAVYLLDIFKETEKQLKALLSTSPTRCMFWVYFLTDVKKLKELSDEAESSLENYPNTSSSRFVVSEFPCFTSTPKKDD